MSTILDPTSQKRQRDEDATPYRTPASTLSHIGNAQFGTLFSRLSNVARYLGMAQPGSQSSDTTTDVADIRSLLAPAMHDNANIRDEVYAADASLNTPIYGEIKPGHNGDIIESLSLRRDLSQPENPPFGIWWTYTVEETLLWPILEYQGNVNSSLDVILEDCDSDSDSDPDVDCCDISNDTSHGQSRKRHRYVAPSYSSQVGLDDGNVVPGLIESFLRNIHIKFPITEPQELRSMALDMIENGLGWDSQTCQVLLACALGAISSRWDGFQLANYDDIRLSPQQCSMAQEYFKAGQKRLGMMIAQSSLIAAQNVFLAGTFQMYAQKPVRGWRLLNIASIACRAYISKRIAREGRGKVAKHSRSMEQRLCWSCFKAEREVSCEFGMQTSGMNVLSYSMYLPTPPNGYAGDMNTAVHSQTTDTSERHQTISSAKREPYEDQSWYFFLTDIMLRKLEMRIDNYFQKKRREAYRSVHGSAQVFFHSLVDVLQEFRYQLLSYYASLPPVMQFQLDDLTPCEDELRHHLRWRVYSAKHDICLPALYIVLHNDISTWPRALVNGLVMLTNECLQLDIVLLKTSVTPHRQHDTWLGLRKGVRSALILVAARRLHAQRRVGLEELRVPSDEECREGARLLVKGLQFWAKESKDCQTYLAMLQSLHSDFCV